MEIRGLPTTTYERAKTSRRRRCLMLRIRSAQSLSVLVLNDVLSSLAPPFPHLHPLLFTRFFLPRSLFLATVFS